MTREQLQDAANCQIGVKMSFPCRGCKCVYVGMRQQIEDCIKESAKDALRQMDRAEQWKAIAAKMQDNMKDMIFGDVEAAVASMKEFEAAMEQEAQG